jgi:hypothetical protein
MGKSPKPLFSIPTISPIKADADKQAQRHAPNVIIKCIVKYNFSFRK